MNSVERVKLICKERKIPISKLESDLGFSNGYIGQLRKGIFPADRLAKIASYLEVTIDYLLTGEETKKSPTDGEPEVTDREIKAAFFRGADMTDEEMDAAWEDVMDLRDIVIRKRKRDAGGK